MRLPTSLMAELSYSPFAGTAGQRDYSVAA